MTVNLTTQPNKAGWASCLCPFHRDTNPSASFNVIHGGFACYTCGEKRNGKQMSDEFGEFNLPYASDVERQMGLVIAANRSPSSMEWRDRYDKANIDFTHTYYLQRNLSSAAIMDYRLKVTPDSILIPTFDSSGLIGVTERMLDPEAKPKYLYHSDSTGKPPLWPYPWVDEENDYVFLTEGVFGAMRLRSLGYMAYSTMGVAASTEQIHRIVTTNFRAETKLVVFYDDDLAGVIGAQKIANKMPCLVMFGEADETNKTQAETLFSRALPSYEMDFDQRIEWHNG